MKPMARFGAMAALALSAAACGPVVEPTDRPQGSAAPTGTPTAAASLPATPEATPDAPTVRIYLVLGAGRQTGLVPVLRPAGGPPDPAAALSALLAGPTDPERAAVRALETAIPRGTRLLGIDATGATATVDLSGEFDADAGVPTILRVAQVVYTLTRFPGIDAVRFRIDGEDREALGSDRFPVDRALGREDLTAALPPMFVDEPAWGVAIRSPVRVAGLANAFEATFELRIADAAGRALAAGTVTATCGTGCWGTFEVSVPFSIQAAGPGSLQVFELSARDGGPENLREYPVLLVP